MAAELAAALALSFDMQKPVLYSFPSQIQKKDELRKEDSEGAVSDGSQ